MATNFTNIDVSPNQKLSNVSDIVSYNILWYNIISSTKNHVFQIMRPEVIQTAYNRTWSNRFGQQFHLFYQNDGNLTTNNRFTNRASAVHYPNSKKTSLP